MQLEHYFDVHSASDIRLTSTRIGIETILLDYLDLGLSPEEIVHRYPALTMEQVFATLTYYWRNQAQIDNYLAAWKAYGAEQRRSQASNPPAALLRFRARKQQEESKQEVDRALAV